MFSNYLDVEEIYYGSDEKLDEGVFLFETAFEIANPIGGINTVLKTKTPSLLKRVRKDHYAMLGIWPEKDSNELKLVEEGSEEVEKDILFKIAYSFMKDTGITIKCGEWMIRDLYSKDNAICFDHCPRVILFVPGEYDAHKNLFAEARYKLWKKFKLHFPEFPEEHNRFRFLSLVSGVFVSMFVAYASNILLDTTSMEIKNIIVHSHEWCGGVAQILLYCDSIPTKDGNKDDNANMHFLQSVNKKKIYSKLKYVFTTHATILGRCLSASGMSVEHIAAKTFTDIQLYDFADQHGVTLEYAVERLCAETATVFTTVSEVTAKEATGILHVKPNIITINGSFALDARKLKISKWNNNNNDSNKQLKTQNKTTYNESSNRDEKHCNDVVSAKIGDSTDVRINTQENKCERISNENVSSSKCISASYSNITSSSCGSDIRPGGFSFSCVKVGMCARHSSEFIHFIKEHFSGIHCSNIDTDNMVVVMCCGRNEIVNKGFDIFIQSLSLLNKKLKRWKVMEGELDKGKRKMTSKAESDADKFPAKDNFLDDEYEEEGKHMRGYENSFDCVTSSSKRSRRKKVPTIIGILVAPTQANEEYPKELIEYKKDKREKTLIYDKRYNSKYISTLDSLYESRLITHKLHNPWKEEIIQKAIYYKLNKSSSTRSTYFVWIPQFLPIPGILPLSIRQLYDNIDLGVFPSKYEPWGYTPIECAESGAPSVTTNLAGSGCFFENRHLCQEGWRVCDTGILVVDRKYSSSEETAVRLCDAIYDFITLSDNEKEVIARKCKKSIKLISWDKMIINYVLAYRLAIKKE